MDDLNKLREIFLTDVDPDTRAENEEQIKEWEQALIANEAFVSWQDHDVTKEIAKQAATTYKDTVMALGTNKLTEPARDLLFAKQAAALWLLSLIEKDAKGTVQQIHKEIKQALQA